MSGITIRVRTEGGKPQNVNISPLLLASLTTIERQHISLFDARLPMRSLTPSDWYPGVFPLRSRNWADGYSGDGSLHLGTKRVDWKNIVMALRRDGNWVNDKIMDDAEDVVSDAGFQEDDQRLHWGGGSSIASSQRGGSPKSSLKERVEARERSEAARKSRSRRTGLGP